MHSVRLLLLLACLACTVLAWEESDYELFDLASAIELHEGKGTTFYSWLDVLPSASTVEIGRAYRRKSLEMHPDKNPGVKDISERFARLGVIAQILRSEKRERYDFFHKNGFPRWRGTGYYYARFRPGLGTVLVFLVLLSSMLQYVVQRMNYNRDLVRINRFIKQAQLAAWGPKLHRIETRRKVKVNIGGNGTSIDEDGEEVRGGKYLDMVVEGDAVYLLEPNGDLLRLDASAATPPHWTRTWPAALWSAAYGRMRSSRRVAEAQGQGTVGDDALETETDSELDRSRNASGTSTPSGFVRRAPAVKAAGSRRRRK